MGIVVRDPVQEDDNAGMTESEAGMDYIPVTSESAIERIREVLVDIELTVEDESIESERMEEGQNS
nr:hypothetical protein Iba_chr07dCG7820 [Ipomoea batatas]